MKTLKKVTKNVKRASVLLIAGLMLMQLNLKASDSASVKANNRNAEISFAYLNEEAVEAEYEIEGWMTDVYAYISEKETGEEEIAIEVWMTDPTNSFWNEVTTAEAPEIAIENWMLNPQDWDLGRDESLACIK